MASRHACDDRRGEGGDERRKRGPDGGGSGRSEVVTALLRSLRAPKRALVQEEELEMLPPAKPPVKALLGAPGDRGVVGERFDASPVQRGTALRNREVVHELVVVWMAVQPGRCAQGTQVREREAIAVLLPLGGDREGGLRSGELAVGVDRVAEVDVEVVVLGRHPAVGLVAVEARLAVRAGRRVGVTGDGEPDMRRRTRRRRGHEPADRAAHEPDGEGVVVARARLQSGHLLFHREVVSRASRHRRHKPPVGIAACRDVDVHPSRLR